MISAKDVINGIDLHLFAFVWPQLCVKQTELVFDIRFRTEKEFKIYWEFVETCAKLIPIYNSYYNDQILQGYEESACLLAKKFTILYSQNEITW